uniref:Putative ixodes 8-cys protein n=1 Tax=Ixodes ricinus TaxID=34613 RepID=A0A0K8R3T5_IXORI
MKVLCIILFFGIAAGGSDTRQKITDRNPSETRQSGNVQLKFPSFIKKPLHLADQLIKMCEEKKPTTGSNHVAINDELVNFKNCTFICKYEHSNLTMSLPSSTPCGPHNQTCAKTGLVMCRGSLPGTC